MTFHRLARLALLLGGVAMSAPGAFAQEAAAPSGVALQKTIGQVVEGVLAANPKQVEQYKSGKSIGGFTPAQRYFIGWAISWMNQIRPENLAVRVKTDVHAPSFLRVTGPVTNMIPFYEAFGVKPGDKMYRSDDARVRIW